MTKKKQIPEFPGYYIDKNGDVYSYIGKGANRGIDFSKPPRKFKPSISGSGYKRVNLTKMGKIFGKDIHWLVCVTFVGPKPTKDHEASHIDGNKNNNHYTNLIWETRLENIARKKLHGTYTIGCNHNKSLLDLDSVKDIRLLLSADIFTQNEIASFFGVSREIIKDIHLFKTYKYEGLTYV